MFHTLHGYLDPSVNESQQQALALRDPLCAAHHVSLSLNNTVSPRKDPEGTCSIKGCREAGQREPVVPNPPPDRPLRPLCQLRNILVSLVDLSKDAQIVADGAVVYRSGQFIG